MPRVALYDDPLFREHDSGRGHPERPERLEALRGGAREAGLERRLMLLAPRPATREELLRVHGDAHLRRLEGTRGRTVRFDPDTQAGPRSYAAALLAAGAVVDAVERVLGGGLDRAFCAVRPPGHHAEPERAMGFCLVNHVAVGAAHALARGVSRVAILDWDVHHGNGTQAIFWREARVLYVSSHQYPFYPGSGGLEEVGEGEGLGFTVNLPLPGGLGDADYARVWREVALPVCRAFDPELVLVSVGFDPHRDDSLAGMAVTEAGFAELTALCLEAASGAAAGRAIFVLEGGYDLVAIARSGAALLSRLLDDPREPVRGDASRLDPLLAAFRRRLALRWPVLGEA
jgi:acetoin utilization deacetylase AcuC-like enzyme